MPIGFWAISRNELKDIWASKEGKMTDIVMIGNWLSTIASLEIGIIVELLILVIMIAVVSIHFDRKQKSKKD